MDPLLTLLPSPQKIEFLGGTHNVLPEKFIVIGIPTPTRMLPAVEKLQREMFSAFGFAWEAVANENIPSALTGIVICSEPEPIRKDQGYTLEILNDSIRLIGHDTAGIFYGLCTLIQIVIQSGNRLPCLRIEDWPDFPVRGVMLDISRDKVPTMETLKDLVDLLAGWKINQLQLYTEHTFAYRNHPIIWKTASPITGQEILELDHFCRERYIELVPNQNSFGHMQRWLIHPEYEILAEITGNFQSIWGPMEGPFSLSPVVPESLELLKGMYDELLPHFSSKYFNVGCDETIDLGFGKSKQVVEAQGNGRVYLDFLNKIYRLVVDRNHIMQFWGDIIIKFPDLLHELPKDAIALEWGYDADHPFLGHCAKYAESGLQFYVCPGTSSWNSIGGRTDNAIANLLNAAQSGLAYGASGYLNTDWGDNGHWQTLPVSYLGFAVGAAYSWALTSNQGLDVQRVLDLFAFNDQNFNMGKIVYDLGNLYKIIGFEVPNSSILFWLMQMPVDELSRYTLLPDLDFSRTLTAIEDISLLLKKTNVQRSDHQLIVREISLALKMLRHACLRGQYILNNDKLGRVDSRNLLHDDLEEIISTYSDIWLARNRPGGMVDSLARLVKIRADYRD
jgi:hypothetical protein